MSPALVFEKLLEACENRNKEKIQYYLNSSTQSVKEYLIQKVTQKDKKLLRLLVPDLDNCRDETILQGILQAAIKMSDLDLAKQMIDQGANPKSLLLYSVRDISSVDILQSLIENGFNIHTENNLILSEWMGSSEIAGGGEWKASKENLLNFIFDYYLEKPTELKNFYSLRESEKKRLFLIGLNSNNFQMMRFALEVGADKNAALNAAHRQYSSYKKGDIGSIYSSIYEKNKSGKLDYEIIEYILNSGIKFDKDTISRAVCFGHDDILDALTSAEDLEYGYEMAYHYENDQLCEYFIKKGVSKESQNFVKIKISALKGDIKELQNGVNNRASLAMLDKQILVDILNKNHLHIIKYLFDSGISLDRSIEQHFNKAMNQYKAYETITYLIEEQGFDITKVKKIPPEYKKKYPIIADMWEKRLSNIFDYTLYLVKEVYPQSIDTEKEDILTRIAQLSALPYVIKTSQGKAI